MLIRSLLLSYDIQPLKSRFAEYTFCIFVSPSQKKLFKAFNISVVIEVSTEEYKWSIVFTVFIINIGTECSCINYEKFVSGQCRMVNWCAST